MTTNYKTIEPCDVRRFEFSENPGTEYVEFNDYKELMDYVNKIVEFANMPCLPKDLEVLRDANAKFAQENFELKEALTDLEEQNYILRTAQ